MKWEVLLRNFSPTSGVDKRYVEHCTLFYNYILTSEFIDLSNIYFQDNQSYQQWFSALLPKVMLMKAAESRRIFLKEFILLVREILSNRKAYMSTNSRTLYEYNLPFIEKIEQHKSPTHRFSMWKEKYDIYFAFVKKNLRQPYIGELYFDAKKQSGDAQKWYYTQLDCLNGKGYTSLSLEEEKLVRELLYFLDSLPALLVQNFFANLTKESILNHKLIYKDSYKPKADRYFHSDSDSFQMHYNWYLIHMRAYLENHKKMICLYEPKHTYKLSQGKIGPMIHNHSPISARKNSYRLLTPIIQENHIARYLRYLARKTLREVAVDAGISCDYLKKYELGNYGLGLPKYLNLLEYYFSFTENAYFQKYYEKYIEVLIAEGKIRKEDLPEKILKR